MNEGFSFRDLIKPGEGARAAMEDELEMRHAREAMAHPKSHWLYTGPAGVVLIHGQFFTGSVLPVQYEGDVGPMTHCHLNAYMACKAHPELRYFTGYYLVAARVAEHSWCVDPDGRVVEVTFPTKNMVGAVVTPEAGSDERTPYMPPQFWSYYGLEFSVAFLDAVIDKFGPYLPVLDPECPYHEQMMTTWHSTPDGFDVAAAQTPPTPTP